MPAPPPGPCGPVAHRCMPVCACPSAPPHPCRVQLVSLCRFVGIQPFGTDTFLRGRLRRHLQEIKASRRCRQQWPAVQPGMRRPPCMGISLCSYVACQRTRARALPALHECGARSGWCSSCPPPPLPALPSPSILTQSLARPPATAPPQPHPNPFPPPLPFLRRTTARSRRRGWTA